MFLCVVTDVSKMMELVSSSNACSSVHLNNHISSITRLSVCVIIYNIFTCQTPSEPGLRVPFSLINSGLLALQSSSVVLPVHMMSDQIIRIMLWCVDPAQKHQPVSSH